jgi:excisionase family DNA binding protein
MEGMTRKDAPSSKRYTVPEAAKVLGIGTDAIRKRIARGTIPHEKDAAGRVYVYLDTGRDEGHDARELSPELVQSLREQIGYLQGVIATRDEELRTRAEELRRRDQDLERRDRIIAALTERIPQALEPPSEARESPESSGPTDGLGEVQDELDTERARREMAESTLREGMDEEGRRREEAERERDDLRQQLEAISAARAAPHTVEEEPERAESRPSTEDRQEPQEAFGSRGSGTARGSLWRRIFGR